MINLTILLDIISKSNTRAHYKNYVRNPYTLPEVAKQTIPLMSEYKKGKKKKPLLEFWIMRHNFSPYHTDLVAIVSYMWEKSLSKIV